MAKKSFSHYIHIRGINPGEYTRNKTLCSVALIQLTLRWPGWKRTFTNIFVHSVVISVSTAADASLAWRSSASATLSGNKLEVLPSFHVTTMSPALGSLTSPFDGEDLSSAIVLSSDASGLSSPLSLGVDTTSSSSPSSFWAFAAAALYFAILLLFLREEIQKINELKSPWKKRN